MKRAACIGALVGITAGAAVTFFCPLLVLRSRVFLWLQLGGFALLLVRGGAVAAPSIPVLLANAVIYGLLGTLVGLLVGGLMRRKPRDGYCRECSYDLRSDVSGICPECGTKIEKP